MLKWNCNFSIEDSSIQLNTVVIYVDSFRNVNGNCEVSLVMKDEFNLYTVKEYTYTFNKELTNIDAVYQELLTVYNDSIII
jgi:hypothetical protein